jgi:hypothetical protein
VTAALIFALAASCVTLRQIRRHGVGAVIDWTETPPGAVCVLVCLFVVGSLMSGPIAGASPSDPLPTCNPHHAYDPPLLNCMGGEILPSAPWSVPTTAPGTDSCTLVPCQTTTTALVVRRAVVIVPLAESPDTVEPTPAPAITTTTRHVTVLLPATL